MLMGVSCGCCLMCILPLPAVQVGWDICFPCFDAWNAKERAVLVAAAERAAREAPPTQRSVVRCAQPPTFCRADREAQDWMSSRLLPGLIVFFSLSHLARDSR